jgi:hypothetical protein
MWINATHDITTASSLYLLEFNISNLHAMSHRSDVVLAFTSTINIEDPAFHQTVTCHLTVTEVQLSGIYYPTAMLNTQSSNPLFLVVMISSKNQLDFIRDLKDLTFQIFFDAWWASMIIVTMRTNGSNNSKHAPEWQLYLHYGIEETSSLGNRCIC